MITKINCRVELDHENWLPRENHSLIRLFFLVRLSKTSRHTAQIELLSDEFATP